MRLKIFLSFFVTAFLLLVNPVWSKTRADTAAARVKPLLQKQMNTQQLAWGSPVYLRIFKSSSELEVWMKKGELYVLFKTYPICTFSGELGPKTRQGDMQSPEGFYSVGKLQLNPYSSYHLSFNLGYPNEHDRSNGRTGDYLMVHGNCVSIGCYAMGDENIEEIYTLVAASLQTARSVPVHIFPFRYESAPANWKQHRWGSFWADLQPAYSKFNQTKQVPAVRVVNKRYVVQ
jgi:murein L,D-transpeptidase YafK